MTVKAPDGFRGVFRTDEDALAVYSESAGIGRIRPAAIAVPQDVEDLSTLVGWANAGGIALIPRGSGSSMPNGAIGEGVIVDLSRWKAIGAVDTSARTIRVGPGVTQADVNRVASKHGLRLPVDPSSSGFCTIGGMASTNAAGSHSMHFGSMRPWVRAIDCVFADGSRGEVRRGAPHPNVPAIDRFVDIIPELLEHASQLESAHSHLEKDSSGYAVRTFLESREPVDLLVGSEGTLAFFVEIEVSLTPLPRSTSSILGAFSTIEAAVTAAVRARDSGAVACELLDRTFLDVAAMGGAPRQVPEGTESALLAEVEGDDAESAANAAHVVEKIFREAGATTARTALDKLTETELWELRHAASPILARLDPNLRSMQFIEDCAVPTSKLPDYVRGVRAILDRYETRGVIFGHAGDAHVHVNPLVDVGRLDWRERVNGILRDVVELTASLGGTLTGEHGDGRLRTPLISDTWPPMAIDAFRLVKDAFDPRGILNPGVKVAVAGERPIGAIKYDPSLPELPARARRVLARVERERAYARSRLDLLDEA